MTAVALPCAYLLVCPSPADLATYSGLGGEAVLVEESTVFGQNVASFANDHITDQTYRQEASGPCDVVVAWRPADFA